MKRITLFLFTLMAAANAVPPLEWQSSFNETLLKVATSDHSKRLSLAELYGAERSASSKAPALTEAANSIVNLWMSEQQDTVELIWWRQSDRATRTLVVALYCCLRAEPIEGIPPFNIYANRFRDKEAIERKEKIDFVNDHLSAIASELARLTDGIERAKDLHGGYESVAKARIGAPLPKQQ